MHASNLISEAVYDDFNDVTDVVCKSRRAEIRVVNSCWVTVTSKEAKHE